MMMARWARLLAPVVMLLALTQSAHGHDDERAVKVPRILDYANYLERCHRTSERWGALQYVARARLFIARTLQIFKHNVQYASKQVGHYLRQNDFTDMSVREIVGQYVSRNDGLEPVRGARSNPDMSGEKYVQRQRKSTGAKAKQAAQRKMDIEDADSVNDEYSFAPAELEDDDDDGEQESSVNSTRRHEPSGPNFLRESDELDSMERVVAELKLEPGTAKRVARLLNSEAETAESKMIAKQMRRLEANSKRRGIVQAPLVEPSNKHFDPSLLPSQGILSSVSDYFTGGAFAAKQYGDSSWNNEPAVGAEEAESLFSSLVGKLADYFSESMFDEDDEDAPGEQEDEEDEDQFEDARENFAQPQTNGGAPARIVYDIDWRQTGCISRAKSQINCNSCYAFATLDLMEFFHCRQKRTQTEFSAQYIIDCGHKTSLSGCQGGKLTNVGMFIRAYGLQLNAVYPYQAQQQQCPFDEASDREKRSFALRPKITGWRLFKELVAWYNWLPKTPLIVGINMPSDFLAYGGGVHDGADCVSGMAHAMLLVGSGKQDGNPFWLLKNSFSQDWGEAGYFRLSKRAPMKCFNSALVARANFLTEASS